MTLEGILFTTLAYGLPILGAIVAAIGWATTTCKPRP